MPTHELPYYEVAGDGPAVVLLHAGVGDSRQWDPQWAALTAQFRALRYDRRGYGKSLLPSFAYTDFGDLIAVLDAAGIDEAAVVASSGGGERALQLASALPHRVTRLLLLSADADVVEPTETLLAFARREDELIEGRDVEAATELNVDTWLGPDADADAADLLRAMQRHAFELQLDAHDVDRGPGPDIDLARLAMPVTIVTGAKDVDYFTAVGDALAHRIPHAERVVLPWAGHLPNLERPDETTALLRRFLDG